jgi:hypothetical protein
VKAFFSFKFLLYRNITVAPVILPGFFLPEGKFAFAIKQFDGNDA